MVFDKFKLSNLKKGLAGCLLVGGLIGCSSFGKTNLSMDNSYETKYVVANGSTFVDNPISRNTLGVSNREMNADVSSVYDGDLGRVMELDIEGAIPYGFDYSSSSGSNIEINGEFYAGYFKFPNTSVPDLGELKFSASSALRYFDADFSAEQIFGKDSGCGQLFRVGLEKSLKRKKAEFGVRGELNINNFYLSETRGFSHATTIAFANYEIIHDMLNLSQSFSFQYPIGVFKNSLNKEAYGSIGLNWKF